MPDSDIDAVLEATNHYETLGILPHEASDGAKLRKAYLRRSVQVHPDKNSHNPLSMQAFQQVTHAYKVLSEDASRSHYERYGQHNPAGYSHETYYAGASSKSNSSSSYEDAMFVFASVAAMMHGNGGGAIDMAQAILFAESFLKNDKSIDLSSGQAKARAAMGAGATLRVVGTAARAVGLKKTGAALDSAATLIQVAGVGAMLADTPAAKKALEDPTVKRTLDAGSQKLDQLGESLATARQAISNPKKAEFTNTSKTATAEKACHEQPTKPTGVGGMGLGAAFLAARSAMGCDSASSQQSATTTTTTTNNSGTSSPLPPPQKQQQQQSTTRGSPTSPVAGTADSLEDHMAKARAAGASAGQLRKGAETAKKFGFGKHAKSLEQAADVAEMAGKAAKVADNPMVKKALQQPVVRRMVEAGGQRLLDEALKQQGNLATSNRTSHSRQ